MIHTLYRLTKLTYLCAIVWSFMTLQVAAEGIPISKPNWIPHNAVTVLPAEASEEQLQFLPIFSLSPGTCLPAPAIDAQGQLGSGLKASGPRNKSCPEFDAANIYTESLDLGDYRIHAYALYFPKDGPSPSSIGGHRHDWEHVLVWTLAGNLSHVTFKQHRGWYTLDAEHVKHKGSQIFVFVGRSKHGFYHSPNLGPGGVFEGICYFCDTRADPGILWDAPHRLVSIESMSSDQQQQMRADLWGRANSPFRNDVFPTHIKLIAAGEDCRGFGCKCNRENGTCPKFP